MKKFLTLCATFLIMGALFVGCIDNTEPDSVAELRRAKARLLDAKAAVEAANVTYVLALAEHERARADIDKAIARWIDEKTAAQKIENDYERGILQAKIEAEIAKLNRQAQAEIARMWKEQERAVKNQSDYLAALITLQKELWSNKINALDGVYAKIAALIAYKGQLESDRLIVLGQYYFYEEVEMPDVERLLNHELELAYLNLTHAEHLYNVWLEIKNLAVEEYLTYAESMMPEIQALREKEVKIRAQITNEMFNLENLKAAENAANFAYLYNGVNTALTNISIPDVFSTNATDMFRGVVIQHGGDNMAAVEDRNVITGVYENTYSFYHTVQGKTNYPAGTIASLGYKNALDQLQADYNLIKSGRIYGKEGVVMTQNNLKDRSDAFEAATKAYKASTKNWRDAYNDTRDGGNWGGYKDLFDLADATFALTYGSLNPTKAEDIKAAQDAIFALTMLPAAAKSEAVNLLPINQLFFAQKYLIDLYINGVKALINGDIPPAEILQAMEISDVLGGITFNPGALFEWVVGKGNAETFAKVVNVIMASTALVNIVNTINAIMPVYYQKTHAFLGDKIYGAGPIFEKYSVATDWEYHAWFLIYILFEGSPLAVGNNIFVINSIGYTDASKQLIDDFLGCHDADYPGYYNVEKGSSKSSTAIKLSERVNEFTNALTFNKTAKIADLPSTAVLNAILKAENDLRAEWHKWGGYLAALDKAEKDLYAPWNCTWESDGYDKAHWDVAIAAGIVPPWIDNEADDVDPAVRNSGTLAFYFMPELDLDHDYPSTVDGEDLYWANLADPWAHSNFSNYVPSIVNGVAVNYYPAIAANHSRLTGVNWNKWLEIGYPTYWYDPILWCNDFASGKTWENNANIKDLAYVPKVFATERNYKQYLFWSSDETQASYVALAEKIQELIVPLQAKVDELYNAWKDATAARILKEYEIEAMRGEAGMIDYSATNMQSIYEFLYHGVTIGIWWDDFNTIYHRYDNALKEYQWHLANLETFKALGIYSTNSYHDATYTSFIADIRKDLLAKIETIDSELEKVEEELAILEIAKDGILDIYIK